VSSATSFDTLVVFLGFFGVMAAVARHCLFMIKVMMALTHLYESDIHYRTRSCGFSVVFAGTNRLVLPSKPFFFLGGNLSAISWI
jgi:hypothetical protein